jgi:hypothetical protein
MLRFFSCNRSAENWQAGGTGTRTGTGREGLQVIQVRAYAIAVKCNRSVVLCGSVGQWVSGQAGTAITDNIMWYLYIMKAQVSRTH